MAWETYERVCPTCEATFLGRVIKVYCTARCRRVAQRRRYVGRDAFPLDQVKSINGRIAMAVRYGRPELAARYRGELARWHRDRDRERRA